MVEFSPSPSPPSLFQSLPHEDFWCGQKHSSLVCFLVHPDANGLVTSQYINLAVTCAGAAAAEFSARALPGFLQSLGSTSRFLLFQILTQSFTLLYFFSLEINFIYECSPSNALLEAFVKTDAAFRNELDSYRKSKRVIQKDWHPGCTAVATLIVRNKLFVANAGDCRTILCRAGHPFVLTKVSWDLFTGFSGSP